MEVMAVMDSVTLPDLCDFFGFSCQGLKPGLEVQRCAPALHLGLEPRTVQPLPCAPLMTSQGYMPPRLWPELGGRGAAAWGVQHRERECLLIPESAIFPLNTWEGRLNTEEETHTLVCAY